MAFFVVIFTPPNNVEAFVTIRGVAVSAGRRRAALGWIPSRAIFFSVVESVARLLE